MKKKSNHSLFGMPPEVKFCKKCVVSNQRPSSTVEFKQKDTSNKEGIFFNEEGICSACEFAEMKEKINWKERENKLEKLLRKYRKKSGYDVVFPVSSYLKFFLLLIDQGEILIGNL
tara:strand:- start:357 stop:704 length:348 start_codon:yes stop_codon:yes gene_type:complete